MKGRDFLVGMVLGSIVGAAMGLLLAPQSGEETRDTLSEQARELGDKVKESGRQFVESSRDLLEQGKSQVGSAIKRGREQLDKITPSAEQKPEEAA